MSRRYDSEQVGRGVIELAHEATFKPTRPIRESLKLSRKFEAALTVKSVFD